MTSTEPMPSRPDAADAAALYDALTVEHATIYGYGIVSAHPPRDDNDPVAEAMKVHRAQRERTIELLRSHRSRRVAGGRLPAPHGGQRSDRRGRTWPCGWRATPRSRGAVLEQARAGSDGDAVRASRCRR